MKYQVHTFGCKVNTYDSGLIQKNLSANGFENAVNQGGIHVLNTCAVTAEATKEAVRVVRRIKVKDPFATVVVTGCAAQVDTGSFENLPGVDLVVANSHKGLLPFLLDQYFKGELKEKVFKSNIFRKNDFEPGGGIEEKHSRAFVKIQDGCNSFCSYCIIPFARGKSRSLDMQSLAQRVNELHAQNFQEVVLTGVHIGDYQDESKSSAGRLEDLLEYLLKNTKMPRYRLTSLEPVEISARLLQLYQDPRMCPHFHMSIQSGQDEVLSAMKRNYLQKDVVESLHRIQAQVKNSFVGMDVIVGFPNETPERFEETFRVLADTPWTRLHVFPYSERPGTKAASLAESIPVPLRKERSALLRNLSLHRYQSRLLAQRGTRKQVLWLNKSARGGQGLSRDYWPVSLLGEAVIQPGQEIEIDIEQVSFDEKKHQEGFLQGRLASEAGSQRLAL